MLVDLPVFPYKPNQNTHTHTYTHTFFFNFSFFFNWVQQVQIFKKFFPDQTCEWTEHSLEATVPSGSVIHFLYSLLKYYTSFSSIVRVSLKYNNLFY